MRLLTSSLLTLTLLYPIYSGAERHQTSKAPSSRSVNLKSDARGFDFYYGHWQIHNRRLLKPLQGKNEWEEFDATGDCMPILGGAGNQDSFVSPHRAGFIGMSLRLFDPQSRQWSIYWIDNRSVVLQPPVVGQFSGNVGIFEGPDHLGDRPILVRYIWSKIDTPTPRWEQAFSTDQGKTWETNWIMDMQRVDSSSQIEDAGSNNTGSKL